MPIISIIIPNYNGEEYLSKCLESVLLQTFKDFEIICVDDGSTDNSINIIKSFQKKDSRILLFQQNQSGPGCARNLGIENSAGDYILFLDSDDILAKDALSSLYNYQIKYDVDFICGKIKYFDNITNKEIKCIGWNNVSSSAIYNINDIRSQLFQKIVPVNHGKLFIRKIILDNNLKFEKYNMAEDALFVYSYLLYIKNLIFIDNIIYEYRLNVKNSLTSKKSKNFADFIFSYNKLKENLIRINKYKEYKKTYYIAFLYCFIHLLKVVDFKEKFILSYKFFFNLLINR